ncbi:MAG: hypothetical protein V3S11_06865 [Elusimicrobiota bacterium]
MKRRTWAPLLAAALLALALGPLSIVWAVHVSGAAGRVPGRYPAVAHSFGQLLHGGYQQAFSGEQYAPSLEGSALPALMPLKPEGGAVERATDFTAMAPLVEQLAVLDVDEKAFAAMTPKQRREVLLLAAEGAQDAVLEDAYQVMGGIFTVLDKGRQGAAGEENMRLLQLEAGRLAGIQNNFGAYLPQLDPNDSDLGHPLRQIVKFRKLARERIAEHRARLIQDAGETAKALTAADIGLAVVSNFEGDSKRFGDKNWDTLEGELEKVREMVASGAKLSGEQGNIKFLTGPLRGMGEIKFRLGNSRTHRVFFRYLPGTREIVLLRVLARETLNNPLRRDQLLIPWMSDEKLLAEMYAPDAETIPLMRELSIDDFDIRLGP